MSADYCRHGHTRYEHPRCFEEGRELVQPKILVFDVESSLMRVFVFGLGEQRVGYKQIDTDRFILSWSAKWLFDSKVMSGVLTPSEARKQDDSRIVASMWKLLDEADIVIAHNGAHFDVPLLNTRFLIHGHKPPMYYQVIDTLTVARRTFRFSSNALDYINMLLDIDGKKDTNLQLWKDCYVGDKKALEEMVGYNRNDVAILEELYVAIRPWIKTHPNVGLYMDSGVEMCPRCGSDRLHWKGFYFTPAGRFEAFRCKNCGGIGRKRTNDLDKEDRKVLVRT